MTAKRNSNPSNKTISKTTTRQRFELKSLEDIWYSLLVLIIQVICLHKGWLNLQRYISQSWLPAPKPNKQIYFYLICLLFNTLILTPLYIFASLFKINSYANDRFKFGVDLDYYDTAFSSLALNSKDNDKQPPLNPPPPLPLPNLNLNNHSLSRNLRKSHSSFSLNTPARLSLENRLKLRLTTVNIEQQQQEQQRSSESATHSFISSSIDSATSLSKKNQKKNINVILNGIKTALITFKQSMPISNLTHLILAFCFIFPNILMISKEIEYGLRPKGNVYHTELDFLLSRPLQRFSESISINLDATFLLKNLKINDKKQQSNIINNNKLKYQLIASSLDDINEINYLPRISIELFNYAFALVLFSIQYSSTSFWHLNKAYTLLFSIHLILFSLQSILSLSAYEILFKFQTIFINGIKLSINTTNTTFLPSPNTAVANSDEILYKIPFLTQPNSLSILFLLSSFSFLLSCIPIYSFGIYQYKSKLLKLKQILLYHMKTLDLNKQNQLHLNDKINVINLLNEHSNIYSNILNNKNVLYENSSGLNDNLNTTNSSVLNRLLSRLSPRSTRRKLLNENGENSLEHETDELSNMLNNNATNNNNKSTLSLPLSSSSTSTRSLLKFILKSHKYHLVAFLILILICVNSLFIFYDYLCLYQLTSDIILFYSILIKFIFLCWYLLIWLVLSFKIEWTFEFKQLFKLNYWHFLNKLMSIEAESKLMKKQQHQNELDTANSIYLNGLQAMGRISSLKFNKVKHSMSSPSVPNLNLATKKYQHSLLTNASDALNELNDATTAMANGNYLQSNMDIIEQINMKLKKCQESADLTTRANIYNQSIADGAVDTRNNYDYLSDTDEQMNKNMNQETNSNTCFYSANDTNKIESINRIIIKNKSLSESPQTIESSNDIDMASLNTDNYDLISKRIQLNKSKLNETISNHNKYLSLLKNSNNLINNKLFEKLSNSTNKNENPTSSGPYLLSPNKLMTQNDTNSYFSSINQLDQLSIIAGGASNGDSKNLCSKNSSSSNLYIGNLKASTKINTAYHQQQQQQNKSLNSNSTSKNDTLDIITPTDLSSSSSSGSESPLNDSNLISNNAKKDCYFSTSISNINNAAVSVCINNNLANQILTNNNLNNVIYNSGQETDSGRHSMSDSPSIPTQSNDINEFQINFSNKKLSNEIIPKTSTKLINLSNNNAAGTFTSKCILSSGNQITFSQKLQQQQQPSKLLQLSNISNVNFLNQNNAAKQKSYLLKSQDLSEKLNLLKSTNQLQQDESTNSSNAHRKSKTTINLDC